MAIQLVSENARSVQGDPPPRVVQPPGLLLPQPPTDEERDAYLGPQQRWIGPVSFVGYCLIVTSVAFFVARHLWAAALLVPLAISMLGTTVSLVTSSRRRRDSLQSHRAAVEAWQPETVPSVDVFLPSAGEDLAVLHNTYAHVAQLRWPGRLSVHVLDDSGRDAVAVMAAAHGFDYLSRPDRGWFKKAGNLRFGFERTTGDYIFILDADFVPRPDALTELVPYMSDPTVGIVQSPQFFDVDPRMNWLQRAAGSTQVLFYRWVQPSRDRSRAPICVGTSALYRRAALDESGGYALIGHSEDVHTGVNMMRVGRYVRYVPIIVTKGLCPDTFDQFATQQYRWCTGSMSLLFSPGFHRIRMTVMQRLSYWSGFFYYITTGVNVFAMALPSILMGFFASDRVTPANYVFVTLAMVGRQAIVPIITREQESLVGLARIQTTYSFCHALALFDVLRGRTDTWVATGAKARSRTAVRVRRLVRWWCITVQALLWVAITWHTPQYGLGSYWLMIAFTLMNLYVVYPLILGREDVKTFADLRTGRAPGAKLNRIAGPIPASVPTEG